MSRGTLIALIGVGLGLASMWLWLVIPPDFVGQISGLVGYIGGLMFVQGLDMRHP